MTPELDAVIKLASFKLATAISLAGIWSWLGSGHSEDENEEVIACHDLVLDALSDADGARSIELHTDENIREQLSIEQAQALHEDAQRRRWSWRRN